MPASFTPTIGPPNEAWTSIYDYDASSNLTYTGLALSNQPKAFTYTVSSYTKANPGVVTTSAAHGLQSGQRVNIASATGSWAALNGDQIVTVVSPTTFSIAVDTSAYTGSFDGVLTTIAPRTNASIWALSKNYFDGSNRITRSAWAGGNTSPVNAWDSRTTYAYN